MRIIGMALAACLVSGFAAVYFVKKIWSRK